MQRLIIKNFGPIQDMDIEVKDFMVLVGPQASGKSTVAKLIYFFKSLRDDLIIESLKNKRLGFGEMMALLNKNSFARFYAIWGNTNKWDEGFVEFQYSEGLYARLILIPDTHLTTIDFSEEFKDRIKEASLHLADTWLLNEPKKGADKAVVFMTNLFWHTAVRFQFDDIFADQREIYYIPAGRIFHSVSESQSSIIERLSSDLLLKEFSDLVNRTKADFGRGHEIFIRDLEAKGEIQLNKVRSEQAIRVIEKILGGEYQFEKENEFLLLKNGKRVNLTQASSGQQEILWILYILFSKISREEKSLLIIEEPEAHIYPEAQKLVIDLISIFFNVGDHQNSVIINTHSPYILGSINTHLLAGSIGPKNPEATSEITPDWIDPKRAGAWLLQNGKATSIIDDDLKIIQNEVIDGISGTINETFDRLFNIKFDR